LQALPFRTILYDPSRILVGFKPGLFGRLVVQQLITLLLVELSSLSPLQACQ